MLDQHAMNHSHQRKVRIPLHGPPISSAAQLFARTAEKTDGPTGQSDLLKAIHVALRGSEMDVASVVHSTISTTEGEPCGEEELTWDTHTVVLSYGGTIYKKWNFVEEGQSVQWACCGKLELSTQVKSMALGAQTSSKNDPPSGTTPASSAQHSPRPTFGPFSKAHQDPYNTREGYACHHAVYIFLRSIGKVFLINGLDYTFSLPFIVRKAWPLFPHGVMIQRVLDPVEMEESEVSGDAVLPTIFSLTNPFSEAAAVGLTAGIIGGAADVPPALKDEEEISARPLVSIPFTEHVVWVSDRGNGTSHDIVVTVSAEKSQLSIWRYTYIKPKDTPVPLGRSRARSLARKRQSLSSVHAASRRHSAIIAESSGRLHAHSPHLKSRQRSVTPEFPELPPLSALPGMPPALSNPTTLSALVTGKPPVPDWPTPHNRRRSSLTRNSLSVTMDRMVLGGKIDADPNLAPIQHGRMRAAHWMEKLHSQEISEACFYPGHTISAALFDQRWDGDCERSLLAVCFPATETMALFRLTQSADGSLHVQRLPSTPAISVASIRATRQNVPDLLVVTPDSRLALYTHGLREIPLHFFDETTTAFAHNGMDVDIRDDDDALGLHGGVVAVKDVVQSSVTLYCRDGWKTRTTLNLTTQDFLTSQALQVLSLALPVELHFKLHQAFLTLWSSRGLPTSKVVELDCFFEALYEVFDLHDFAPKNSSTEADSWLTLSTSSSYSRFREDPVLRGLKLPPAKSPTPIPRRERVPHKYLSHVLQALHTLCEDLRFDTHHYDSVLRLAPIICHIALVIAPGWADYWKRLCPDAIPCWPSPETTVNEYLDDRIAVCPPDMSAVFYAIISHPDLRNPRNDDHDQIIRTDTTPSYAYGRVVPFKTLHNLTSIYKCLSDESIPEAQKRAENAVRLISTLEPDFIDRLPLGIAAPLREAARTCQLSPPNNWPLAAYRTIGRNDLVACVIDAPDDLFNDGYRTVKDYISQPRPRPKISDLVAKARAAGAGTITGISGVELDLEEFTNIRFGQDRRLEEVSRMLCSSAIPSIRLMERPELNEHDQAKEQQIQVARIGERTLALPFGRAMFTFGSAPTVTHQAYVIPKLEYRIRLLPLNIVAAPEIGKIPADSYSWGEFHNGVAAGLRLSSTATAVDSSWIAFNRPSELTPEHAGFLYGLGLTGHLKEMLTWHTFSYLTPKHDLTSIGVLLGLAAANVGNSDRHVTKLLAVHTPALLPTPTVDLNVSLMTQAAGLAGVGLLYMGTKNRRMAEVCLNQISRHDLIQPDLSNEHREAYTYSAALAFGMIMLGKGSSIPADLALLTRLNILIHGDTNIFVDKNARRQFDINLTSPAAVVALGLMYLKTERQDIADMLPIPDTVLALNRIQPSFLLLRTIARSLIMWDSIAPTSQWLTTQIPEAIASAIEVRFSEGKQIDDALELAYYNIMAACCFVIALKYAGTARQEAYLMIVSYFDLYSRLVFANGPAFDHKIKRAAVREGLNLISISLSMVMAGTGEITCMRRIRFAYGMHHPGVRYGIHAATHMSLGLLFLGGGRFTLGTSDAAIACMVTAFFPRFHQHSSDNKSYLQALRHLWVLAVEPRCLIPRDVDSKEVIYLPIKITMKEGNDVGTTQLISPTLIPDLDKLQSIRVDTPRYWPLYLDTKNVPSHRSSLLRSQTLYVKRRTAFLSYTEDPRGSRSMFVRSGTSTGDAATLDYPQLTDVATHPAGDLSQFISSFSNDPLFLAFADRFARDDGETASERLFHAYCHASLLDSILQDKPQTLQSHLILYRYRMMSPSSRYFHLNLQDLRFAADFYSKVYDRRFSGRSVNNAHPPLVRETTVSGILLSLDAQLDIMRNHPDFLRALGHYARGEAVQSSNESSPTMSQSLAWYLLRNAVPTSTLLAVLQHLAQEAHTQCVEAPPPEGTSKMQALDQGIRDVLHGAGTKMTTGLGSGWSVRCLEEIIGVWKLR